MILVIMYSFSFFKNVLLKIIIRDETNTPICIICHVQMSGIGDTGHTGDLHEVIKQHCDELIAIFKKPGAFLKYVNKFWKYSFFSDDVKESFLDDSKGAGEDKKANELFTTIYKTLKEKKDSREAQLPLMLHILNILDVNEDSTVATSIREVIANKQGVQLPLRLSVPVSRDERTKQTVSDPTPITSPSQVQGIGYEMAMVVPESQKQDWQKSVMPKHDVPKTLPNTVFPARNKVNYNPQSDLLSKEVPSDKFVSSLQSYDGSNHQNYSRAEDGNNIVTEEIVHRTTKRSSSAEVSLELLYHLKEQNKQLVQHFIEQQQKRDWINSHWQRDSDADRGLEIENAKLRGTEEEFSSKTKKEVELERKIVQLLRITEEVSADLKTQMSHVGNLEKLTEENNFLFKAAMKDLEYASNTYRLKVEGGNNILNPSVFFILIVLIVIVVAWLVKLS